MLKFFSFGAAFLLSLRSSLNLAVWCSSATLPIIPFHFALKIYCVFVSLPHRSIFFYFYCISFVPYSFFLHRIVVGETQEICSVVLCSTVPQKRNATKSIHGELITLIPIGRLYFWRDNCFILENAFFRQIMTCFCFWFSLSCFPSFRLLRWWAGKYPQRK